MHLYIDSTVRTISETSAADPIADYRASLRSKSLEAYGPVPGATLYVDGYGRDFEGQLSSYTINGLHVVGDGVLVGGKLDVAAIEKMIVWHDPDYQSNEKFQSVIFSADDDFDATREKFIAECPYRFIIWQDDADLEIEEVAWAAHQCGFRPSLVPGLAFVTDDADAVERYKRMMAGWVWVVHDKLTGERTEAP